MDSQKGTQFKIYNDIPYLTLDIEINGSGHYTIDGSVIDPSGGSKHKIKIKGLWVKLLKYLEM